MFVEIFFIFIAPVLAVKFYKGSWKYWALLLFLFVVIAASISAYSNGLSFHQMGIRSDNLLQAITLYIPFVVLSVLVLRGCSYLLRTKRITPWRGYPLFIPVAIFLSVGQQFLYQGFLFQRLTPEYGVLVAIFITALLYAFLHILFPRPVFSFVLTFVGGVMFAALFSLQPNLLVASIAHTILNITAIQFSFLTSVKKDGLLEPLI